MPDLLARLHHVSTKLTAADTYDPVVDALDEEAGTWTRIRGAVHLSGDVVRMAKRDPNHIAERLTLMAVGRQAEPARAWADRALTATPKATPALLADDQRRQTIKVARIDGAIAGTPFFVALVPAYLTFLQQEVRLMMRTAALYGHDPADAAVAADFLVLRGVHKTKAAAHAELETVRATPLPPAGEKTPWRSWYQAVLRILILAGFIGPPGDGDSGALTGREKAKRAFSFAIAGAIWALTWIVPVTFMIAMSWGCENDAKRFGQRVVTHYGDEGDDLAVTIARADRTAGGNRMVNFLRGTIVFLSVSVPLLLIAVTILDGTGPFGVNLPDLVGVLAAVAVVIGIGITVAKG